MNSFIVNRWKSERSVSKAVLRWNRLGRFVRIRSIHVGLAGFLKHVGFLIKLLIYVTKVFHGVFVNTYIKISYENEVIVGFAMFVNDTV